MEATGLDRFPLGSTPRALNGARFITSTGDGLALAGSVTELGPGSIASVPALWTAPGADGPWALVRLPASQSIAEAHAARCDGDTCLVVGADGGTLAVWDVRGSTVARVDTPEFAVAEEAHRGAADPDLRHRSHRDAGDGTATWLVGLASTTGAARCADRLGRGGRPRSTSRRHGRRRQGPTLVGPTMIPMIPMIPMMPRTH